MGLHEGKWRAHERHVAEPHDTNSQPPAWPMPYEPLMHFISGSGASIIANHGTARMTVEESRFGEEANVQTDLPILRNYGWDIEGQLPWY